MTEVNIIETGGITADKTSREVATRLLDMRPNDAAVRTHAIAPYAIEGTDQPPPQTWSRIEEGKVTFESTAIGMSADFPDLALTILNIATAREAFGSEKLNILAAQVREQLKGIDLLLDLSRELTALPDQDSHEPSDAMRGLIERLENDHKIQIWKNNGKISKEKLGEIKAQIGSHIDKLRTALQTKISTEIQPETTNLQSIMNILQQIIQSDARLKRKTSEVPR